MRLILPAILALAPALWPATPAFGEPVPVAVEGERMSVARGPASPARHSVVLGRGGRVAATLTGGPWRGIAVRAAARRAGEPCRLTVGGYLTWDRVVVRSRRLHWRVVELPLRARRHRVSVSVSGCRAGARLDRLVALPVEAAPVAQPAIAPPAETAPPSPGPAVPPRPAPAAPTPVGAPAPPPEPAPPVAPLRQVEHGSALFWARVDEDPRYGEVFRREFDSITPENEMKMEQLVPRRGEYRWGQADAMVDWAGAHGKTVHGHTLVWGNQNPWWIERTAWTREALLAVMEEHITTVMRRYAGRVASWDVVNEPFADDGTMRDNVWLRGIGPDYVEHAFRFARAADPGARLYLNEIGADVAGRKSDAMLGALADFRSRGVPIDGAGFQHHHTLAAVPYSRARVEENLRRFAALGLEVAVSEMDVALAHGDLERQARVFGDVAAACNAVPACVRFTVWGVADPWTWMDARERPLLLDGEYRPKPAYDAVRAAFAERPEPAPAPPAPAPATPEPSPAPATPAPAPATPEP